MIPKMLGRRSAEILSFALSCSLLLGLFTYLGFDHFKHGHSPYLDLVAEVKKDEIRREGESFLIPVTIRNRGERTPTKASFSVIIGERSSSVEVEYLSRQSTKVLYLAHDADPSDLPIKVTLEGYQF